MSKYIPKPVVAIGYSTKKKISGSISSEIDTNKVSKMNDIQFRSLLGELTKIKMQLLSAHIKNTTNFVFSKPQLREIQNFIDNKKILAAVKYVKEIANTGLVEAKEFVESLKE